MDAYTARPESDEEKMADRRAHQLDVQLDLKMHQFDQTPEGQYIMELFQIESGIQERLSLEQRARSEGSSPSAAARHRPAPQTH
jgi:hypothetical protein